MSLIKSISGIRGTIGGNVGESLTPIDIVKFTTSYGAWVKKNMDSTGSPQAKIVIGRDGRISGEMVRDLVAGTLVNMGFIVIDLGLSTTPTVEMATAMEKADGGIIITASHNPKEWNALKLLNKNGEFINANEGKWILDYAEKGIFEYSKIDELGKIIYDNTYIDKHIEAILSDELVDKEAIKNKKFKIVVDAINSTGAIAVDRLLKSLGVSDITILNSEITGNFNHNPEPLPENLTELSDFVKKSNVSLGIAVDPDVDRLAFVCEDGTFFGEEYTLVAVSDYILSQKKGSTVSNFSSTSALKDITEKYGEKYFGSAVGEINVVNKMKDVGAVIGGEGNGGIIYPMLHYGRDALIGIALFLTHLAHSNKTVSELRREYPNYFMSKNKVTLDGDINILDLFEKIKEKYKNFPSNTEDGLKIEFDNGWVHLRVSNTEPIIRIYSESKTSDEAQELSEKIKEDILKIVS